MKNTGDVQGFQFNLYLPEGMTVAKDSDGDYDVQLSADRTTATRTNVFRYVMRQDGSLRVICTSSNGKTFSGTDGDVVLVRVNVASYIADGDYPVVVKDIVMSDLDGRLVSRNGKAGLGKGVYVVNGKKVVVK